MSRHSGFPIVPVSLTALLLLGLALARQERQQQPFAPVPLATLASPSTPPAPALAPVTSPAVIAAGETYSNEEPAAAATEADSVETDTLDISPQDALPKIHKAVRDHIRERYPNSRVEGVFTLPLGRGNTLYLAGADTVFASGQDRKRHTVDVLVRLYARRNGSGYWRAESLGGGEAVAALLRRGAGETVAP